MAYVVVLLATRWGSELGGLNVFNRGLASGLTQALPKGSRTICFVEQLPKDSSTSAGDVELHEVGDLSATTLVPAISAVCKSLENGTVQGVLIVGHDIITGSTAIQCVNALRSGPLSIEVKSAVIGHMDYAEYAFKKGASVEEVAERSAKQRHAIADADCAFAVGPLLQRNLASARNEALRPKSPVRPLVPGVEKIPVSGFEERVGLWAFICGRLNREDDPIKNSALAVKALAAAYVRGRKAKSEAWQMRGQLFAWGVDPENDASTIVQLTEIASNQAAFELRAVPFSADQAGLHQALALCHLALMPSWHEGFGLSGWEALCAGVPLVCSRQSGLAMLLHNLMEQFPDQSFRSIEFINIAGHAADGSANQHDIDQFADVLLRMAADIKARKQAAIDLARLLKREFSWKRCASDLMGSTGWYFPGSVRWSDRQLAARQTQACDVLAHILTNLERLDLDDDWGDLTTAFNELSDAGKNADLMNRVELRTDLSAIGVAIDRCLAQAHAMDETARDSGRMDVCWRFMAACANICLSFREFAESYPPTMLEAIWKDSFLTKELLYYGSSFADEFVHLASDIAKKFFLAAKLPGEAGAVVKRLARLESRCPTITELFPTLESDATFRQERERCEQVRQHGHDIAQLIEKDPSLAPTALACMTLALEPSRQVADQAVAFFSLYHPDTGQVKGHWRGDKRVFAALATASLSTGATVEALRQMAQDEDESIRWASLHLAFSPVLRRRLEAAVAAGSLPLQAPLNVVLGEIVDTAVAADAGHPWLHREFLRHYLEECARRDDVNGPAPLTILDFPVARWSIGPVVGDDAPRLRGAMHPEVADARYETLQVVKRILLVLPPIEVDGTTSGASPTSTPALGLGLLASHLLAQGHDVQVADCHRFPKLRTEVLRLAQTFDVIGFNTVFSTIRSTMKMMVDIRNRTQSTTLVVGGPAAKLDVWRFSTVHMEDAQVSWDFAIGTNAVENLSTLVASLKSAGPWPSESGIVPNRQSWNVIARGLASAVVPIRLPRLATLPQLTDVAWSRVVLDRRVYRFGGEQYEPGRTRSLSQPTQEAHIVMSQGCDWDCAFCTERATRSGGEQRRKVAHVLNEIRALVKQHPKIRIQFVDDNLLPQLASAARQSQVEQSRALAWTHDFLEGLARIGRDLGGSFGWRGIFRMEDFFAYEGKVATDVFIEQLQRSGCRMLAFGVEHANEEQRRRNKAADEVIANDRIKDLFQRLRTANIFTKAYFMLGGAWESQESARQTIDFAIESGASLAYFALYKDFSKATSVLSKEQDAQDERAQSFIRYEQLLINWDDVFAAAQEAAQHSVTSSAMLSGKITEDELACYCKLAKLGFRFNDLVKYNDFHDEGADGGHLLRAMTWDSPSEYFITVEQAYRRFYLRPAFVQGYASLLSQGY
jgi:radical SAM superfamily enzyme YgiQ (UPF0313 family)